MTNLSEKLGDVNFDGLVTDVNPAVKVEGGPVAPVETPTVFKRGSFMVVGSNGGLELYDGTGDIKYPVILAEDIEVGTEATVCIGYTAGCFDPNKLIFAEGFTPTESEMLNIRVACREWNIYLKSAAEYVTEG